MWIYIGNGDHPYNLFDFSFSRSRVGPVKFLSNYNQTPPDRRLWRIRRRRHPLRHRAGCWAHARRKFVDTEKAHPAIARDAVTLIKRLYAVEEQAPL